MTCAKALAAVVVAVVMGATSGFQKFHGAPTFYFPPIPHRPAPAEPPFARPLLVSRVAVDQSLPCPGEGFYPHPTNCSQFYRCVDYAETGRIFSRYGYECPKGLVFAADITACVPGVCAGTVSPVQPSVFPPTIPPTNPPVMPIEPPVQPTDPPVIPVVLPVKPTDPPVIPVVLPVKPTDPPVMPTDLPVKPTDPPVMPTDLPVMPTDPPVMPTDPPVMPVVLPVVQPVSVSEPLIPVSPPPSESCMGQYEQHEQYCNFYRRCNDTETRYMCPAGTVFDAPRQMCRISAADEGLCDGKVIGKTLPSLRADAIVDGHIQVPDNYIITPMVPFMPLANRGVPSPYLGIGNHRIPAQLQAHPHNPFYVPGLPAPYHGFPADTLPPPAFLQPQEFSIVRPGPLTSPYRASGFNSQSVNNVRRPENHLHFPHYSPYVYQVPEGGAQDYYFGMYVR